MERALELHDRLRLAFELRLDGAVRPIAHEPTDLEGAREVSDELPEAHSLHPAGEPKPHPYRSHAGIPPEVK